MKKISEEIPEWIIPMQTIKIIKNEQKMKNNK